MSRLTNYRGEYEQIALQLLLLEMTTLSTLLVQIQTPLLRPARVCNLRLINAESETFFLNYTSTVLVYFLHVGLGNACCMLHAACLHASLKTEVFDILEQLQISVDWSTAEVKYSSCF